MSFDNDLNVTLDLTRQRDDRDLEAGALLPVGRHHVQIRDVRREGEPPPHLAVKYEVLSGPAAGSVAEERFFLSDKAAKRLAILGRRLGLLGDGAFGKRAGFDASGLVGRDLVVEVVHETYDGK